MASSSSRKETDTEISRTRKIPRNETYKESLLRKIASGDPNHPILAEYSSASRSQPLEVRSTQTSASTTMQEFRKTAPSKKASSDFDCTIDSGVSAAAESPKIRLKFSSSKPKDSTVHSPLTAVRSPVVELEFSKIVSMALLVGPDLESKSNTSLSIKNTSYIERQKRIEKNRNSRAAAISKIREDARKSTGNAPSQISSVTTKKRRSEDVIIPETQNKLRKTIALPKSAKESIKPESKIRNLIKKPDLSNSSGKQPDRKPSTNTPDLNNSLGTSMEISNFNEKKRKSEAITTSALLKKARKTTENPPAQIPSMALKKRKSEVTTTSKTSDRPHKVTAIPKPGKDQSKIRNSPKVPSSVDFSKTSNLSNNSHTSIPSDSLLDLTPRDTASLPDCSTSPMQESTPEPVVEYQEWDPKDPSMWVYYATYDEYGDVDKYVFRKIWYNGPDRELFHLRDHGSLEALWLFEERKKKAKALEIQRKKEEEEALEIQRKKEEGQDLGSS